MHTVVKINWEYFGAHFYLFHWLPLTHKTSTPSPAVYLFPRLPLPFDPLLISRSPLNSRPPDPFSISYLSQTPNLNPASQARKGDGGAGVGRRLVTGGCWGRMATGQTVCKSRNPISPNPETPTRLYPEPGAREGGDNDRRRRRRWRQRGW